MTRRRSRTPAQPLLLLLATLPALLAATRAAAAQDVNIPHRVAYIEARLLAPDFELLEMEQARPLIAGDRSARVVIAGVGTSAPIAAKWKPVGRNAQGFNNEPRYELAAYHFQKLFLDEPEYVVPPTVLRSLPLAEYRELRPQGEPTLRGTESVLFLLAFWLEQVTNRDPWDAARFDADTAYARNWANLNILTHLIEHRDSNVGNLLVSTDPSNPRVFAVDNDVAFRSRTSNVGDAWRRLHVNRLPQHTVERLRAITRQCLDETLGVVAEFEIVERRLVPVEPGPNLRDNRGVRVMADRVQFGLTSAEIRDIERRIQALLRDVDRGRITVF